MTNTGTASAALADVSDDTMSVTNETDNRRDSTPTFQRHTQAASRKWHYSLVKLFYLNAM
jgi:hypothetical protein